ncbi:MAG: glucosyltransferase I RfaG, partial [Porticoccaceae bacterium]|nr:glucosyltransferase I RfaG [Porticoccaceae bacterium]
MNIAFVIYRYFPFGGQQRNMLAMAQEAISRGHGVRVLCREWQGDRPPGVEVELLTVKGFANHAKMASLAASARERLAAKPADLVVGFVKLPGLQAYYAADPCFAEKAVKRGWWYRLSPRTRTYLAFEESVFGRHAGTHVLEVSVRERPYYQRHYGTPDQRFHTLVPGISPSRRAPEDYRIVRNDTRQALGFTPSQHLLLSLGSG